jgi:hypothetical protein
LTKARSLYILYGHYTTGLTNAGKNVKRRKVNMLKKILSGVLVASLVCALGQGVLMAQEEKEGDFTYGIVKTVSGEAVTIEEYTYDEDGNETVEDVVYFIDTDTEYENVAQIGEIVEGIEVDIEYVEKDGKKVATYIYVYTLEEEY